VRSGLITVLRTVRFDRGLQGSLLFSHRVVFEVKRTAKMNGSRFSRSDRTVRSGFQNRAPIHSARSSLFLFRRFCLEHMRTVQLTNNFWHHQLASSMGKKIIVAVLPLPRQRVVWYSLAQ